MIMKENPRKKPRWLEFWPSVHSIYREEGRSICVCVTDSEEPDRRTEVVLTDDEALQMADRIAQHLGMRVVSISVDQSVKWGG